MARDDGKTKQKEGQSRSMEAGKWLESQSEEAATETVYSYAKGGFFRSRKGERMLRLVCSSLPYADWFDLVAVRAHPDIEDWVWVAVADCGLYFSRDGGVSFEKLDSIAWARLLFLQPHVRAKHGYAVYVSGKDRNGREGIFVSYDLGRSFESLDL